MEEPCRNSLSENSDSKEEPEEQKESMQNPFQNSFDQEEVK